MGRIVVGIDGKPASYEALRWSVRLAGAAGHQVLAVCCWSVANVTAGPGIVVPITGHSGQAADAFEHLEAALAELGDEAEGVDVQTDAPEGDPAEVLIELSKQPDTVAVVIGRPHKEHFLERVVGSVLTRLTQRASAPVVVVPIEGGAP